MSSAAKVVLAGKLPPGGGAKNVAALVSTVGNALHSPVVTTGGDPSVLTAPLPSGQPWHMAFFPAPVPMHIPGQSCAFPKKEFTTVRALLNVPDLQVSYVAPHCPSTEGPVGAASHCAPLAPKLTFEKT